MKMPEPLPLVEVLMRQRRAWQSGQRPTVESLLEQHPHLSKDADSLLDLIYNEIVLREEVGQTPALADYSDRFPHLAEELRLLFEVDNALTVLRPEGEASPSTVTTDHTSTPRDALPRLEGCDLLDELGRGAMGVVYRGWQRAAKRPVAVKLLAADVPTGRVHNEVQAVSRLHHPNIVGVYEVKEHEGRTALVLEYVEAGNLAQKLGGKPVAPREAAQLVEVLARAMAHAHARGVIHRDLKPSNILLSGGPDAPLSRCTPKISDFGLAKLIEDSPHLTRTSDILGTPSYMAPEQAGGAVRELGPPADIYALGAILYECLTGRPPFVGQGMLDTLELVRTQEPVPPRELNPAVPRDLQSICLKCLHKQPVRRYPSAEALANDLHRFQIGEPIQARPIGWAERLGKAARRRPLLAFLFVLTILASVTLIAGTIAISQMLRAERDAAVRQAAEREQRLGEMRALFYTAELLRVDALRQSDPAAALRRLEDPVACPLELRCFSWAVLRGLCHPYRSIEHRHLDAVIGLAASQDGVTRVSLCRAGTVRLADRNLKLGKDFQLATLAGDGSLLVVASRSGRCLVFQRDATALPDWQSDRPLGAIALSPDARVLALNGGNLDQGGRLSLHEARTGKLRRAFKEVTNPLAPVAFSADGALVATALRDESIQVWDARTGRAVVSLYGFDAPLRAIAFHPQGESLAAGASDGVTRLWNLANGRELDRFEAEIGPLTALAFHPRRRLLVLAGQGRDVVEFPPDVQGWDLAARRGLPPLRAHGGTSGVAFGDDATLLTAGADGLVKAWDYPGEPSRLRLRGFPGVPAAITATATHVAWLGKTPSDTEAITLRDRSRGGSRVFRTPGRRIRALAMPQEGQYVLTGGGNEGEPGEALLWDPTLGRPVQVLPGHTSPVVAVGCTPTGQQVLTGCADGTLRLWTIEGSRLQWEAKLPAPAVVVLPEADSWIVLAGATVYRFDPSGKKQRLVPLPDAGRTLAVRRGLWACGGAWGVLVGRLDHPEEASLLDANTHDISHLALSEDARTLATAGPGRAVRLWDVATRQERLALGGHLGGPCWCAFAQGVLLTASRGGELHYWHGR
jgi:WD40 repeat protein